MTLRRSSMPEFIAPCLARPSSSVPEGPEWVHEVKYDGYRIQARIDRHRGARLLTRTGLDWTSRFGRLPRTFQSRAFSTAIIDGEVVVGDSAGLSSFSLLVEALRRGDPDSITFQAFDLLHLDGVDTRASPLDTRKGRLFELVQTLPKTGRVHYSNHVPWSRNVTEDSLAKLGLEGLVSKRLDVPYRSGRHGDWLKVKFHKHDEFVVGGFIEMKGASDMVGALVLGFFRRKQLVYAGRVGTGFDEQSARDIWRRLKPLQISKPPYSVVLDRSQSDHVTWVRPELVVDIKYTGWTTDQILRHAVFVAVRDDKPARFVGEPFHI